MIMDIIDNKEWEGITKPKKIGGLGLKNLKDINEASISKLG